MEPLENKVSIRQIGVWSLMQLIQLTSVPHLNILYRDIETNLYFLIFQCLMGVLGRRNGRRWDYYVNLGMVQWSAFYIRISKIGLYFEGLGWVPHWVHRVQTCCRQEDTPDSKHLTHLSHSGRLKPSQLSTFNLDHNNAVYIVYSVYSLQSFIQDQTHIWIRICISFVWYFITLTSANVVQNEATA